MADPRSQGKAAPASDGLKVRTLPERSAVRYGSGSLPIEIPAIVSNHRDFERLAASYDIPFHHLPVTPDTKAGQEARLLEIVAAERIDLVVLARYMQVLSNDLCGRLDGRAINIHHSFLPSFKGARPYHQAHQRATGDAEADGERVEAVRAARRDAWIGVDCNQGYTPKTLEPLISTLVDCQVSLIEQPFARGREADMDGLRLPLMVGADESCLDLSELDGLAGRFDMVNIKLDKCGGLTEGLMLARRAKSLGLKVMVGNMVGTSLSVAPAFLLGQLCDLTDLDGPLLIENDPAPAALYQDGAVWCPPAVWGPEAASQ